MGLRPRASGSAAVSAAAARVAAGDKAPRTWNRYATALLAWEAYASAQNTTFLPADPAHFANFLAESAEGSRGYTQTKQRACAIAAFSRLALLPSPSGDETVSGVRAGIRRTRCGGRRGRARPIFSYEIPAPDDLASPPRRQRPRGSNVLPASVDKRGLAHAARISAIMSGAALRWDCLQEAQLGDVVILPEMADFSIFGSKTDPTLAGQAAVLPASDARNSGMRALLEGTRAGLTRLAALPPQALQQAASRFRAARTALEIGSGPDEFSNWPEDIQALAAPLYAQGLPVHCLPICGEWMYARLDAASDLAAEMPRSRFMGWCRRALTTAGVEVGGLGSHSFRRGCAVSLFHGGADPVTVSEVLRHRSLLSSRPYVTDAARMAGLAASMTAAAPRRPVPVAPSGRGPRDGDAVRPVPPPALAALAHRVPGGGPGLAVGTRGHIPVPRGLGGRW